MSIQQLGSADNILEEFKPGDVVKMKSGGPFMTIQEIIIPPGSNPGQVMRLGSNNRVFCAWFNTLATFNYVLSTGTFAPEMLERISK